MFDGDGMSLLSANDDYCAALLFRDEHFVAGKVMVGYVGGKAWKDPALLAHHLVQDDTIGCTSTIRSFRWPRYDPHYELHCRLELIIQFYC